MNSKSKAVKKLKVSHYPSMKFVSSTSTIHDSKGTRTTKRFTEAGANHKKMLAGFASPGYQRHLAERSKRRGEDN